MEIKFPARQGQKERGGTHSDQSEDIDMAGINLPTPVRVAGFTGLLSVDQKLFIVLLVYGGYLPLLRTA